MPDTRRLEVQVSRKTIVLIGDLTADKEVYLYLNKALACFAMQKPIAIEIDASKASVLKGGVGTWARVVGDCLTQHELHYLPSQLGMALYYFGGYRHGNSHFADANRNHVA